MRKITPVLMAGGSGTRLWPVSRTKMPKQFCALVGEGTMLQQTLKRFEDTTQFAAPIILTHDDYRFITQEQCEAVGITPQAICLETERRNTGVVGALAALVAAQQDPNAMLLLAAADHVITNVQAYHAALQTAAQAAELGYIVTFGITPDKPETGYGYVERGEALGVNDVERVKRFVEKPNLATAMAYIESGQYVWNSGMFMASTKTLLAEYEAHAPALLTAAKNILAQAETDLGFTRFTPATLIKAESISIDYCLMEKTEKAAVLPVEIGWSDVGAWPAIHELSAKDEDRNHTTGVAVVEKCKNTYVQADKRPVMAIGLSNIAVIDTADAVLVLNMDHSASIKAGQAKLAVQAPTVLETHPRQTTLWGQIETIESTPSARIRRVTLAPLQHLSYQSHQNRSEHWLILSGNGLATLNGQDITLKTGASLTIAPNMKHGLQNTSQTELLVFLEVQTGFYADETDITRYELVENYKKLAVI